MLRERLDREAQKRRRRPVALVGAAADGDEEQVVTELRHFADPDTEDTMGMTALDAAPAGKHNRIVSILLEAGANHQKSTLCKELKHIFGRLTFIEGVGEGGHKYSGICAGPDGRLYCAPCDASKVLVIDPGTQTLSFMEGAGGGGMKYLSLIHISEPTRPY